MPSVPYRPAPARVVSETPDDLFLPSTAGPLRDRLLEVLAAEAPIHVDVLLRRVLDAWSFARVTPRARACVDEALKGLQAARRVELRDDVAWRPGQRLTQFRTGGEGRKAEHLAVEEVALAAGWILEQNVALGVDDLCKETAKQLGFARMGTQVAEAMRAGLKRLEADGRCVVEGTRVRLAGR